MSLICVHLHENVLASLGVSSRRSPSLLSAAGTPSTSCSSFNPGAKMSRDACMVDSSPVQQGPVEDVKCEQEEEEKVDVLVSTLDLAQLLRLSCARAVRHGEIRAQVGFEQTGKCVAHAFEDHLYLAEPTRRTRMTRNNGCLDLGALCKRSRTMPAMFEWGKSR